LIDSKKHRLDQWSSEEKKILNSFLEEVGGFFVTMAKNGKN
jgi:hypothetical protein